MSNRSSQDARFDLRGRDKVTALIGGKQVAVAGVVLHKAPPSEPAVARWAQIRRDHENIENGYREHQYRMIERSVILCAELEENENLAKAFIADCKLENLDFKYKKNNLLRAILSYVLVAKTQNQFKIIWKYERAANFLRKECAVAPDAILAAIQQRGGIEAVARDAANKTPMATARASEKDTAAFSGKKLDKHNEVFLKLRVRAEMLALIEKVPIGRELSICCTRVDRSDRMVDIYDIEIRPKLKWGN